MNRAGSFHHFFSGPIFVAGSEPPPFAPSDIAGLVRAWRFDQGVTTDVNGISNVTGAWGTGSALTPPATNAPSVLADLGPQLQDVAEYTSANSDVLGFSSAAMTDFTFFMAVAIKAFSAGSLQGMICRTNNSNGYLAIKAGSGETIANFQARSIGGALTDVPAPFPINKNFQIVCMSYVKSTGIITPWINGVKGSGVSVGTGGFTFDRLGAAGSGTGVTGFLNGYVGAALLYDTELSDANIEQVDTFLQSLWRGRLYISNTGSDSSATPWARTTPWQTIAKPRTFGLQPGDIVYLEADHEFTDAIEPATAGLSGKPITWRTTATVSARPTSLTDANLAHIFGGEKRESGWTAISSSVQTLTDVAAKPKKVWVVLGDGTVVHIYDRATSQDYSFEHSVTTLTVRYDGATDLNTLTVWLANADSTQDGVEASVAYNEFVGLDLRYWGRSGINCAGTGAGNAIRYSILGYNPADGWDTAGSGHLTVQNNWIVGNGVNKVTGGSDGDGGSCHGDSGADSEGNLYQDNLRANLGCERSATFTSTNDTLEGGNYNVVIFDQSSTASENGSHEFDALTLTRTHADDQVNGIQINTGINNTVTVDVTNSTFTDNHSGGGKAINNDSDAVLTQSGNTFTGFASLT